LRCVPVILISNPDPLRCVPVVLISNPDPLRCVPVVLISNPEPLICVPGVLIFNLDPLRCVPDVLRFNPEPLRCLPDVLILIYQTKASSFIHLPCTFITCSIISRTQPLPPVLSEIYFEIDLISSAASAGQTGKAIIFITG